VEHPSDGLLEGYSMRRLTGAEMAPLDEHLLICEGVPEPAGVDGF
jgi:hypothetical protein